MLVGAFAVAHTPQLLARPDTEDRELVLRVHAAFARVKRRLEALRPDAIAMIAGDHIEAFFLSAVPALAVYVGTECAGTFGRYRKNRSEEHTSELQSQSNLVCRL